MSVFSSAMTSLAFSWSFQKVGPFITASSSSRRASLSPKSKRVSEMDDPLDHALGRTLQFHFHGPDSPWKSRRFGTMAGVVGRRPASLTIRPDRGFGDQTNLPETRQVLARHDAVHDPSAASPLRRPAGLHLGHARTFLAAWLSARSAGGRVVLRVEDLDASRVRPEAAQGAIDDLRWLGLDWDEGPDVGGPSALTSSRDGCLYQDALERLKADERVYPCTCTRAEIARAASAPHAEDEGPSYPGTCSGRSRRRRRRPGRTGRSPGGSASRGAGRLGRPVPGPVGGDPSGRRRRLHRRPARGGAVVSTGRRGRRRGDGRTQVIRGDDLIPSTPRQILLYRALGWPAPAFGHVPLVVGPDGRRLAKRDGRSSWRHSASEGSTRAGSSAGWRGRSGMTDRVEPTGRRATGCRRSRRRGSPKSAVSPDRSSPDGSA